MSASIWLSHRTPSLPTILRRLVNPLSVGDRSVCFHPVIKPRILRITEKQCRVLPTCRQCGKSVLEEMDQYFSRVIAHCSKKNSIITQQAIVLLAEGRRISSHGDRLREALLGAIALGKSVDHGVFGLRRRTITSSNLTIDGVSAVIGQSQAEELQRHMAVKSHSYVVTSSVLTSTSEGDQVDLDPYEITDVIPQSAVMELLISRSVARKVSLLREKILHKLQASMSVEPGEWSVEIRLCESRPITWTGVRLLYGGNYAEQLKAFLPAKQNAQLEVTTGRSRIWNFAAPRHVLLGQSA